MIEKLRTLPLSIKITGTFVILALACGAVFIALNGWLFHDMAYGAPMQRQRAIKAMNVYPGADLIHETEFRDDGNYAVQSYFYVTDDSLDEVKAYYAESDEQRVIYEGEFLDYLETYNDLNHIMTYGGSEITIAHEGVCERKTYAECLSTILLDLDDEAGATLIIISFWITFL